MPATIVTISDTHTMHAPVVVPDGDILIHAGDFTNRGSLDDVRKFSDWLGTLPHEHKIVIAGNHDFCFERDPDAAREALTNCIYLEDSAATVEGIKFYGSPWQPWFYDWAFNLQRGAEIKAKWDLIPEDTDVLITHGPPAGYHDLTTRDQQHVGCEDLLNAVHRIKPRLHVFGHIHEAYGQSSNEHTTFINPSTCNLAYNPINDAIIYQVGQ